MNQKVDPCEDFYSFACGGFETKNVIPDDQSSVTTFSLISDEVTEQLRNLIERPIKEGDAEPFKLVKKLYQSCLNKSKLITAQKLFTTTMASRTHFLRTQLTLKRWACSRSRKSCKTSAVGPSLSETAGMTVLLSGMK